MNRTTSFVVIIALASASIVLSAEPINRIEKTLIIKIGTEPAVFRRISPKAYKIDYPDFYMLETEVTNRLYREYLRATHKRKDDTDVLKIVRERAPKVITYTVPAKTPPRSPKAPSADTSAISPSPLPKRLAQRPKTTPPPSKKSTSKDAEEEWVETGIGTGTIVEFQTSTGDVPYSVNDEKMIWRDGEFPKGLDDHPVALITLDDAESFCEWLSKSHPDAGLFRYLIGPRDGGEPFIKRDGVGMLPDNSALASSVQGMDHMVRTFARLTGRPIWEAIRMASLTPARIAGREHELGSLERGKRADVLVLDKELSVRRVFIDGVESQLTS